MPSTLLEASVARGKDHVIFDFDDTLYHLDIPWDQWGDHPVAEQLAELDPEPLALWREGGCNLSEVQNAYAAHPQYGRVALQIIRDHNEWFEMGHLAGYTPNDELLAEVQALDPQTRKFIWSSNTRRVITHVLRETGLVACFERIVTSNDVVLRKPSPEGFGLIRDPSIPLGRYLMVGDSAADRGAAAAADISYHQTDFFH